MATEFIAVGTTGLTLTAHFFSLSDGKVWDGTSAYVEPSGVNATTLAGYRTALSEIKDSENHCVGYELAIPAGIVVPVHVAVYSAGGTTETWGGDYDPQIGQILEDTGTTLPATLTTISGYVDCLPATWVVPPTATQIWQLASMVDGKTPQQAFQYIAAALAGEISGAGTGTEKAYGLDGTTERVRYTVDSSGNRTAVSYDP